MTPAQMAANGRFGDQVVAHLTPGEIQVPPQLQNQKLMEDLRKAFAHFGLSPSQFTAGSPAASTNPATGAPEYSLLAALLPIIGGIGGGLVAGPGGAAVGGAVGGGLGAAADHQNGTGVALSALGGGAGGYLAGGGLGSGATVQGAAAGSGVGPVGQAAAAPADVAAASNPFGGYAGAIKTGYGAGLGSVVGGSLSPQPQSSALPSSFTNPLPALNTNYNQLLGNNQGSKPSFAGYNPYAAVTGGGPSAGGGYNFYSPSGNGT